MRNDDFEPPPVPINSRALVATLKRRLMDAIETGRASEAKTLLDIIERLARLAWLDDRTPQERAAEERAAQAQAFSDVERRIALYLAEQAAQGHVNDEDL